MILLDTMAAVWMAQNDRRLGPMARKLIDEAASDEGLGIAAITPWEVAMLVGKERLMLGAPVADWMEALLALPGVELLPLTAEIGVDAGSLPRDTVHGDPADRIVMATARALRCPVMTSDELILGYAGLELVRAVDARR